MKATVYDALFVTVFKRLHFYLSTFQAGCFQDDAFSMDSTFETVFIIFGFWRFRVLNDRRKRIRKFAFSNENYALVWLKRKTKSWRFQIFPGWRTFSKFGESFRSSCCVSVFYLSRFLCLLICLGRPISLTVPSWSRAKLWRVAHCFPGVWYFLIQFLNPADYLLDIRHIRHAIMIIFLNVPRRAQIQMLPDKPEITLKA